MKGSTPQAALAPGSVTEAADRPALFISHAAPEDNAFTLWLGAKLSPRRRGWSGVDVDVEVGAALAFSMPDGTKGGRGGRRLSRAILILGLLVLGPQSRVLPRQPVDLPGQRPNQIAQFGDPIPPPPPLAGLVGLQAA